mgnify:FL=1
MTTAEREKAEFRRAMRDLGESEGKRIYDEAYNRCRKDKMSEAGSKEFAESVVVGHANWVMR